MALDPVAIRKMAQGYTAAWCAGSAEQVGSFFDENATSIINAAEPTIGRPAIAADLGAFFADFPDLVLHMDDLRTGGNQAVFLWTLEGTHDGTGMQVRISGWQNWRLSDDLLILHADGGYDAEEYDRQVQHGVSPPAS